MDHNLLPNPSLPGIPSQTMPATVARGYTFPASHEEPSPFPPSFPSTHPSIDADSDNGIQQNVKKSLAIAPCDDNSRLQSPLRPLSTEDWVAQPACVNKDAVESTHDNSSSQRPLHEHGSKVSSTRVAGTTDWDEDSARGDLFRPIHIVSSTTLDHNPYLAPASSTPLTPPSVSDPLHIPSFEVNTASQATRLLKHDHDPLESPSIQESIFFAQTNVSPTRNRFLRRRSSQKPSLNLIVEDPSPPPIDSASITCFKDETSPLDQGDMLVSQFEHSNTEIGEDDSGDRRPPSLGTKAPRRAFSMSDIRRHEHEYPVNTTSSSETVGHALSETGGTSGVDGEDHPVSPYRATQLATQASANPRAVRKGSSGYELAPSESQGCDQKGSSEDTLILQDASSTAAMLAFGTHLAKTRTRNKLEPRTITVADASPASLAAVVQTPIPHALNTGAPEIEKPVAYNPRLPHPAILYVALGGNDVDLSDYFDENNVFVDIMYRRVGDGGNKVLLQEGEEVAFPSVKDPTARQIQENGKLGIVRRNSATASDSLKTDPLAGMSTADGPIFWRDDHVFGSSTTSGMTLAEATHQLYLLRNIHLTAQQLVSGDEELLRQATDLISNVGALAHLTETVQQRRAVPSAMYSSPSEWDSGYEGRGQKKRSRKALRRGDQRKPVGNSQIQIQPRHLESRASRSQVPYGASSTFTHTSHISSTGAGGAPTLGYADYIPTGSPASHSHHPLEQYQPYHSALPNLSSSNAVSASTFAEGGSVHPVVPSLTAASLSNYTPPRVFSGMQAPLTYKFDICRTYWIHGECPYRLRCFFVHPPPSAHHTVARDTIASLEDPVSGGHLQMYQDQTNIQNLQSMLHSGVDISSKADLVSQPTIRDLLRQVNAKPQQSAYAMMPLLNGAMVPMYPLHPASGTSVTSTAQGHFIHLPLPAALHAGESRSGSMPPMPVQLSTKEDIATYLDAGKTKIRSKPSASRQSNKEINGRRFSTAGPLSRKSTASDSVFPSNARPASGRLDYMASAIKRPASRTLKQVQQSTLQENSREGTRLETTGRKKGSLQYANVISKVDSRLSTRPF